MDPDANLQQQAETIGSTARGSAVELYDLRNDLRTWLHSGGFAPDWTAYPAAARAFLSWAANTPADDDNGPLQKFGEWFGQACRQCWSQHTPCLDCGAPVCACDGHECIDTSEVPR